MFIQRQTLYIWPRACSLIPEWWTTHLTSTTSTMLHVCGFIYPDCRCISEILGLHLLCCVYCGCLDATLRTWMVWLPCQVWRSYTWRTMMSQTLAPLAWWPSWRFWTWKGREFCIRSYNTVEYEYRSASAHIPLFMVRELSTDFDHGMATRCKLANYWPTTGTIGIMVWLIGTYLDQLILSQLVHIG